MPAASGRREFGGGGGAYDPFGRGLSRTGYEGGDYSGGGGTFGGSAGGAGGSVNTGMNQFFMAGYQLRNGYVSSMK